VASRPVRLTPHQFDLLRVLARHPGKLLTHQMLLQQVWGPEYGSETSLLRVHVARLRHKIEPEPARPRFLLAELGAGYRLMDPSARGWPRPSRQNGSPSLQLPGERTARHPAAIAPRPGDQRGARPQQVKRAAIVPL